MCERRRQRRDVGCGTGAAGKREMSAMGRRRVRRAMIKHCRRCRRRQREGIDQSRGPARFLPRSIGLENYADARSLVHKTLLSRSPKRHAFSLERRRGFFVVRRRPIFPDVFHSGFVQRDFRNPLTTMVSLIAQVEKREFAESVFLLFTYLFTVSLNLTKKIDF